MSNEIGKLGKDLHYLGIEVDTADLKKLYKMGWRKRGSLDDRGGSVVIQQAPVAQSFANSLFANPHGVTPMQPKLPGSWINGV